MTASPPELPRGLAAELARQYDVVRVLGRGGMGVVFLARERSLDRLVAIKVLSGADVGSTTLRERFRREARVAARLVHPHIVPLHAFGETDDALYFVMGYVEGETLSRRLERESRIPLQSATRILDEIADALAFAHREGVVHRDVKPENILLEGRTGRALLADFGVARAEGMGSSVTRTGLAIGTPSYMSPEQAVGAKDIDGRADLYALGVVGYRMLMGRLPFTGSNVQELMAQHAAAKPDDLALAVAPADRAVAELVMRALEKDPAARWPRAEDFRAELAEMVRRPGALSDDLQRIRSVGTKLLAGNGIVAGLWYIYSFMEPEFFGQPEAAFIVPASLLIFPAVIPALAAPAAKKHGWWTAIRTALQPPEGWAHWWPKALRPLASLWDRLPKPLRRARNFLDWYMLIQVAGIAWLYVAGAGGGGAAGEAYWNWVMWGVKDFGRWLLFPGSLFVGHTSWVIAEFVSAKRKLGLSARDMWELLALPHRQDHSGWTKPKFARLLSSEPGASLPSTPQTPKELESAIVRLARRLRATGLLPDDEGIDAARSVRTAIEALEAEVQRLHQDLDPAESERLDRRLEALRVDDDAELRKLLESQRAVIERLALRRQEKEARRDRLRDQLVTLWMQLKELDARVERGAQVDPELTGSVRALSRALAHTDDALSETEKLLAPPEDERSPTPV